MTRETKKREEDYSRFMSNVLDDDETGPEAADVTSLLKKRDHSGLRKKEADPVPAGDPEAVEEAATGTKKPRFSLGPAPSETASRVRIKLAKPIVEEIIAFRDSHASVTLKSVTPAMWLLYKKETEVEFDEDGDLVGFDIMAQQKANVRLSSGKETSTLIFPVSQQDKEQMETVIKSVGGLRYRQMVELMWDLYKSEMGIDQSKLSSD